MRISTPFFPDIFDSGAERAVRIQFPEDEISDHQNASENGRKLNVKERRTANPGKIKYERVAQVSFRHCISVDGDDGIQ